MNISMLSRHYSQIEDWISSHIAPWIAPPLMLGGIVWVSVRASEVHWLIDLLVTGLFTIWCASLLIGWKRRMYVAQYPSSLLLTIWLCTAAMAIVVFAAVSSMLTTYQTTAFIYSTNPSRLDFVSFYFYHFIDALPGLRLWDTYSAPAPELRQHSFLAGTLLLVFRAVVLATLLSALKDWFSFRNGKQIQHAIPSPDAA